LTYCKVYYSKLNVKLININMENQCAKVGDEHSRLLKIINFRFPHIYKKVGLISAVLIFVFLIGYKYFGGNDILIKDVCRTVTLLFLLIASLSKDVIEDEYIEHVRFQSYVIAFTSAIAYSIGLPLIALVLDLLITGITDDGNVQFYQVSAFEVMFILLGFQLLFFETMKRFGRAQ